MEEKRQKQENVVKETPMIFETPKLVEVSASANLTSLECLAQRGGSCSWK